MHPLLEQAEGAAHALLAHAIEKPGELLTGLATVMLVVVTFRLFKATKVLAEATDVLAQSAREDSRNRRIQATADAWMKLRLELELPNLTQETSESSIDARGKAVLPQLRALEVFSHGVNSGAYDLETFNRISGNWFRQQFRWIKPFIDLRQERNPDVYKELVDLARAIDDMRSAATKK